MFKDSGLVCIKKHSIKDVYIKRKSLKNLRESENPWKIPRLTKMERSNGFHGGTLGC